MTGAKAPPDRAALAGALGVVILYLGLSIALVLTDRPGADEGYYASPALDLITRGRLGTTVLESVSTWHPGMDEYTYWQPPLHFVTLAGWFKIFGFGIVSARALSVAWGLLYLGALAVILRNLLGSWRSSVIATGLVASEYFFLKVAPNARMDTMCVALTMTGLASFMILRARNLSHAMLVSHSFIVASGLTHPNGLVGLLQLVALTIWLERRRLDWKCVLWALPAYVIGAIAWGLYILKRPDLFLAQFLGILRSAGKTGVGTGTLWDLPGALLAAEVQSRYIAPFGLGPGVPLLNRVKGVVLVLYVGSVLLLLISRKLRQRERGLLILTAVALVGITFLTPSKNYYYLIWTTPLLAVCFWAVITEGLHRKGYARLAAAGLLVLFVFVQLSGTIYRIHQDPFGASYRPVTTLIKMATPVGGLVMGEGGLLFGLYPERVLLDDSALGFRSGKVPDAIVIEGFYKLMHGFAGPESELGKHVKHVLSEYQLICSDGYYDVYARPGSAPAAAPCPGAKKLD